MNKLRYGFTVLSVLVSLAANAGAQVSIGIGLPNISIGINMPFFPELVPVPGYPVYYAPRVDGNYFFYDGMYWVYSDDYWYASNWYNGPWAMVEPAYVPLYILRIPVRYYRQPPGYFSGWRRDEPPRWGRHWGRDWEQRRRGWDNWKRGSVPARAPLPLYQKQYAGDRYPRVEEQHELRREHYRYQPRDKAVRQHYNQQGERRERQQDEPRLSNPSRQDIRQPAQLPQSQPSSQQREPVYREQRREQRHEQGAEPRFEQRQQHRSQEPEQRYQGRERDQGPRGEGREQRRDEGRGRGRDD